VSQDYLTHQFQALVTNLSAGSRLALGKQVSPGNFRYSLDQGLWLALLLFCLEILFGYLDTEPPVVFNHFGINYLGAIYLTDFLLLILIARLAKAGLQETGCLIIANLSITPIFLLFAHFGSLLFPSDPIDLSALALAGVYFILLLIWQIYILIRLLHLYLPLKRRKAALLAGFNVGLSLSAALWLFPRSDLWYSDSSESANNPYAALWALSVEDTFYSQLPLMNQAIEGLEYHRAGITDLYLLALGGYGYEKVFLNEVKYVQKLFDRKFDTRNRSLVMVNNLATVNQHPLANRHNLAYALQAIGERIDPQEDIVFLFMTSHGSEDHKFSVQFGPISMDDITPQQVKQALDDSGIRWRVLVVSSCYSGGFIKPLQDPNTLVITAAAQDRKSFGCGSKSEFTDFGDAYFRKGLEQRNDFIEAFDVAAKLVSEKELKERRTHSNPQIFVGEAIRSKLAMLFGELNEQGQLSAL
jgi:hypothetical protein